MNVTCLDNLTYGQKFNLKHKLLNFLNLNITRKNDIKINKYFDTVIILAGLVGIQSQKNINLYLLKLMK